MKFGNREYAMYSLNVLHITNDGLFVDIKHGHQIRTEMRDVKTTVFAVETLIVEPRCAASQWHITQSAQGKVGRQRSRTITICL